MDGLLGTMIEDEKYKRLLEQNYGGSGNTDVAPSGAIASQIPLIQESDRYNVNAIGGGGSIPSGVAFGGRIGLDTKLSDQDRINLGLSGAVVNAKDFNKRMLTGLDAEYQKGNESYGVEYRTQNPGGVGMGSIAPGNPNELWLKYRRSF